MSHQVTRTVAGSPRIVLHDEPPYCKAFEAVPSASEPELMTGKWLVLAFAAWSMPEINAVQLALDAVKQFSGRVSLGLRPFDDPDELRTWHRGLAAGDKSPVWMLLSDGQVRFKHHGWLTMESLMSAIQGSQVP